MKAVWRKSEEFRVEEDALGKVQVPAEHLWGAQTERSRLNFTVGVERHRWGRPVIRAFGLLKKCAALANLELGPIAEGEGRTHRPRGAGRHRRQARRRISAGRISDRSGTQSNMNANEVIANRAIQLAGGVIGSKKPIHPNDDVNHSQSSNDVFPTVMHIATANRSRTCCCRRHAAARYARRQGEGVRDVVMVGRTHLQDATPLTLGQAISGWAAQLDQAIATVERAWAGSCRWRSGHGGRHRAQRRSAFRRDGRRERSPRNGKAVHLGGQQIRGAVGGRCDGQRRARRCARSAAR